MSSSATVVPKVSSGWSDGVVRSWFIALLLLCVAVLAFATLQPVKVLPRIALSPGFALVDQTGQPLTSEALRGSLVLYNFTYTGCAEPCPQTSEQMWAVQERLAGIETHGLPVRLVTISFDPTRDTRAVLREYAERWGVDPTRWHFATGEAAHLKNVIGGGFGVFYDKTDATALFDFDPTFVLVDGAGIIRAKYRTATLDLDVVERDLALIATEAIQSEGPLRLAYEAAHLFMCYPR
jgi:protein SCO1